MEEIHMDQTKSREWLNNRHDNNHQGCTVCELMSHCLHHDVVCSIVLDIVA